MKPIGALLLGLVPLILVACESRGEPVMVGTLERDRIEITSETSEPIVSRHVRDGQAVKAGELLIRQDPSRLQARYAQAVAHRDQAGARVAELQRGPRAEAIRETRALLEAARARTANAQADLLRVRSVYDRGLSSGADLDQAEARWQTAQAEEQAVREVLEAQMQGTTAEELAQAQAMLTAAEAQQAQARLDLDRTELRAPVDGIVDRVLFRTGERPPAGAAVAVLLDASRVYARVYVPEPMRALITPGRKLEVRIDGVEQPLTGTVSWVSADASFTPYFALTEHDRSRLSYLAELDLVGADKLPSGVPLVVHAGTP